MRTPHRTTIALVSGASVVAAALAACSSSAGPTGSPADDASATAPDAAPAADSVPADSAPSDSAPAGASGYADGTYTATGSYESPNAEETIDVSVTLEDGRITAVEVEPEATNPTSAQYQHTFASAIADVVVGKSIDDAEVDAVSGSSLTSEGFNDALAQIASDASA